MGEPGRPSPVKLVAGMIYSDESLCKEAREGFSERCGPEDFASMVLPFDRTRYYEKEMGSGLKRVFITYSECMAREILVFMKHFSREIETEFSHDGRRRVNIDPGYISLENLVLATFKGYSHRIYLGKGVFAEVTLIFEKGSFRPLAWTYPDYASQEVIRIMNVIRGRYRAQLGKESPAPLAMLHGKGPQPL